jgi:hypothetical protein
VSRYIGIALLVGFAFIMGRGCTAPSQITETPQEICTSTPWLEGC